SRRGGFSADSVARQIGQLVFAARGIQEVSRQQSVIRDPCQLNSQRRHQRRCAFNIVNRFVEERVCEQLADRVDRGFFSLGKIFKFPKTRFSWFSSKSNSGRAVAVTRALLLTGSSGSRIRKGDPNVFCLPHFLYQ